MHLTDMHTDDCWNILGIDAIRDKKAIKKAYARKLKVTRPDADPDGFKRLNTAYQECLNYLDYDWYWEDSVSISYVPVEQQEQQPPKENENSDTKQLDGLNEHIQAVSYANHTHTASFDIHPHQHNEMDNDENECEANDSQTFINNLKALVWDADNRNDLSLWQSYLADDALMNFDFKNEASLSLVQELLKLRQTQISNIDQRKYTPSSFIRPNVLRHLDSFFDWQRSHQKLEQLFQYDEALYYFLDDLAAAEDKSLGRVSQQLGKRVKQQETQKKPFYTSSWMVFLFIYLAILLVRQCDYQSQPPPISESNMEQAIEDLRKQGFVFDDTGKLVSVEHPAQLSEAENQKTTPVYPDK